MAIVLGPTNLLLMTVTDRSGKYATTGVHVASTVTGITDAAVVALKNAVQGMSDGALMKLELKRYAINNAPGLAAIGPYDTTRDKVLFEWQDVNGIPMKMEIPGPNAEIFEPNGITVTLDNAEVIALDEAMRAAGATAEGTDLARITKGYRKQNKGLKNRP